MKRNDVKHRTCRLHVARGTSKNKRVATHRVNISKEQVKKLSRMDEAAFLFRIPKILFRKHGGNENFDDNFFKTEIFLNEAAFLYPFIFFYS